jgi:hypothetical protein
MEEAKTRAKMRKVATNEKEEPCKPDELKGASMIPPLQPLLRTGGSTSSSNRRTPLRLSAVFLEAEAALDELDRFGVAGVLR